MQITEQHRSAIIVVGLKITFFPKMSCWNPREWVGSSFAATSVCHSCWLPTFSMAHRNLAFLCVLILLVSFWRGCFQYFPAYATVCSLSLHPFFHLAVKEPLPIPLEHIFLFDAGLQFEAVPCNFFVQRTFFESCGSGEVCLPPLEPLSSSVLDLLQLICIVLPSNCNSLHLLFCVHTLGGIIPNSQLFWEGLLQVPLEQGLFLLCPKVWTSQQCFWVFNFNPMGILRILKSKPKANEWRKNK